MAEVVELFPYLDEEEEEETEEGDEEEDELPYWSSVFNPNLLDPIFTSIRRGTFSSDSEESDIDASGCSDYHLPLPHDLSDHTPPSPLLDPFPETLDSRDFRVLDAVHDFLDEGDEGAVGNRLFVGSPIARAESSGGDLRIVGFGSESDSSEHDGVIDAADCDTGGSAPDRAPGDLGLHLSWGFIPIDEVRRNSSEEFEWEEVDDRLDDRGVFSMMVGVDDDEISSGRGEVVDVQLEPEEAGGEVEEDDLIDTGSNIVWEVLLAMNNHGMTRNNSGTTIEHVEDIPDFEDDQEVFINPSDYEFQIGHFADHDNIMRGSPPAAKLVVEELPSIMLTEEDVANSNCLCAICKDAFSLEERAKQLPCSHLYHNGCILPWLGIRNTCPVCRYELPTEDPEYERLKSRTRAGGAVTLQTLLRSDFEILPGV